MPSAYFMFRDLRTESRMPLTNPPDSSDENFLARSTASFRTTLAGVWACCISWMASRKIARSMADIRSKRQLSECPTINASSTATSFAVPSNSSLAKSRVLSAALALFQNFTSSFESFVAAFEPRAIDGLLQRVAGQHAEDNWHTGIHLRKLQAARSFRANIIIVRGFASNHATDGDECVVLACCCQLLRHNWQFERSRNTHHIHVLARRAGALQSIHGRSQQALGNKAVEPAHNNTETESSGTQSPFNLSRL